MPASLPTKIAAQFAWAPIEVLASSTASAALLEVPTLAHGALVRCIQDLPGAFYFWIIEHLFVHANWFAELVSDRLSDLPACGHQGPHHAS